MLHSTALIGASESSIQAELAARLAAIAYCKPDDIEAQVGQLGSQWDAVWVPKESVAGNFAYIAFNGEQYVVAIRGSVFVPLMDGFYDWLVLDFIDAFEHESQTVQPVRQRAAGRLVRTSRPLAFNSQRHCVALGRVLSFPARHSEHQRLQAWFGRVT